jgi:hypothetical protein
MKILNNKKAVFFQGLNFLLFLFFTAIVLSILFVGLPFLTQEKLTASIDEQNSAVQSKALFQILSASKEGTSTAQKILAGDTEQLYELLKELYGEKVQCRLKVDALAQETKCLKLTNPPDTVEILVPSYDGKMHTINLEVAK